MTVGRQKNIPEAKIKATQRRGRRHSHKAPWPRNRSPEQSPCQALVPGGPPRIQAPPLSHRFAGLAGRAKAGEALEKETSTTSSPPWLLWARAPLPPPQVASPGSASDAGDPESFTVWRGKERQARWSSEAGHCGTPSVGQPALHRSSGHGAPHGPFSTLRGWVTAQLKSRLQRDIILTNSAEKGGGQRESAGQGLLPLTKGPPRPEFFKVGNSRISQPALQLKSRHLNIANFEKH